MYLYYVYSIYIPTCLLVILVWYKILKYNIYIGKYMMIIILDLRLESVNTLPEAFALHEIYFTFIKMTEKHKINIFVRKTNFACF